jgi:hypothetical protein
MSITVTLPYDPVWSALTWAKKNCPSYITNKCSNTTRLKKVPGGWVSDSNIDYFFGNKEDAILFKLTWT